MDSVEKNKGVILNLVIVSCGNLEGEDAHKCSSTELRQILLANLPSVKHALFGLSTGCTFLSEFVFCG